MFELRLKDSSFSVLAAAAILLGTATPLLSADLPDPALSFGPNTVGSMLTDVLQYRKSEDCFIEKGNADCAFVDQNGVKYVVLGKSVISVVAQSDGAASGIKLPYGLKFGERLEVALRKLISAGDDLWIFGSDHEHGVAVVSYKQYVGKNGAKFKIELRFSKEMLTSVKYSSGSI